MSLSRTSTHPGGGIIADELHISRKVEGGKLVQVDITLEDRTIKDIVIAGDFFLHPEEAILTIEDWLRGSSVDDVQGMMERASKEEWKLVGVTWEQVGELILECAGTGRT